jgi:hypothetical protein
MILNKLRQAGANFRDVSIVLRWKWVLSFMQGRFTPGEAAFLSLLNRRLGNDQNGDEEKVPPPVGNRTPIVQSLLMELMRTYIRYSMY